MTILNNINIFIFSWDCSYLKSCKYNSKCRDHLKNKEICSYCKQEKCYIPTFLKYFMDYIKQYDYKIVFIGTQENNNSSNNLHNNYLMQLFYDNHYEVLKNTTSGFKTSLFSLKKSSSNIKGVRCSLFIKKEFSNYLKKKNINLTGSVLKYHCDNFITKNSGAVTINLNIELNKFFSKNISFINCFLPFTDTQKTYIKKKNYSRYRQSSINKQNKCYTNILNKTKNKYDSDVIFYSGNFNYRLIVFPNENASKINSLLTKYTNKSILTNFYKNRDELYRETNLGHIETMFEGVNSDGPSFLPTCKLYKKKYSTYSNCNHVSLKKKEKYGNREKYQCSTGNVSRCKLNYDKSNTNSLSVYKLNNNYNAPSWCNRILYTYKADKHVGIRVGLECKEYNSYDFGQMMAMSNHSAIYSSFKLNITF